MTSDLTPETLADLPESEAIRAHLAAVHSPLEALVHGFCDEAYVAIMEATQDYLLANVAHNLKEQLRVARAQAQHDRERATAAEHEFAVLKERVGKLEGALEPFAVIAQSVLKDARNLKRDEQPWVYRADRTTITYGHLRRARSTLQGEE